MNLWHTVTYKVELDRKLNTSACKVPERGLCIKGTYFNFCTKTLHNDAQSRRRDHNTLTLFFIKKKKHKLKLMPNTKDSNYHPLEIQRKSGPQDSFFSPYFILMKKCCKETIGKIEFKPTNSPYHC